jgi:hypothetical protein
MSQPSSITVESIGACIFLVRGNRVMLDSDLAELYGVQTFRLNEAVKRNRRRFPPDFMFQLSAVERRTLTSQNARSKAAGRGGRRTLPYAFTEHGALMLANILRSSRAVDASIVIVRAFVRFRQVLSANKDLAAKLDLLEGKVAVHDQAIVQLLAAIRGLMRQPEPPRRPVGFTAKIEP